MGDSTFKNSRKKMKKRASFIFSTLGWILLTLLAIAAGVIFVFEFMGKAKKATGSLATGAAKSVDITKCLIAPYGDPCCMCFTQPLSKQCLENNCENYVLKAIEIKGCGFILDHCQGYTQLSPNEPKRKACEEFCSKYPDACSICNVR